MATSTWDWPVIRGNSANSSAHSGRFFGQNSGSSSWMFAWPQVCPSSHFPGLGQKEKEIRREEVPEQTALLSQSPLPARPVVQQMGLSWREDEKGWGK